MINKKFCVELPIFLETTRTAYKTTRPTILLLLHEYSLPGNVFTEPLPTIRRILTQTRRLMERLRCQYVHTKFHKDWLSHSEVEGGLHRHTDIKRSIVTA
jgi:hypothetical protein